MLPHLKKCCCFFSLRRGCYIIVILDFCTHLSFLHFGNYGILWRLAPLVQMVHHVTCVLLVMGSMVKASILMMPYLISDIIQLIFFMGTSFAWFHNPFNTTVDRGVAIFNIVTSLYAWIIVYSLIQDCRQQIASETSVPEIIII